MSVFYGLAGVAAYILTGYLKSGEAFSPVKALKTFTLAALIIALNTAAGVELPAEELAALLNAGSWPSSKTFSKLSGAGFSQGYNFSG